MKNWTAYLKGGPADGVVLTVAAERHGGPPMAISTHALVADAGLWRDGEGTDVPPSAPTSEVVTYALGPLNEPSREALYLAPGVEP